MTQDEISRLPDERLIALARLSAESSNVTDDDQSTCIDEEFNPLGINDHALIVAARLDMTISFGSQVVLVTEPDGCQSRTVEYTETGRIAAMRRAITLLAADSAQYI